VISANLYVVLPITDLVIQTINGWAAKNKKQTSTEPKFTFHERDITHDAPDDEFGPMTAAAPLESAAAPLPPPSTFRPTYDEVTPLATSPRLMDPSEIGGVREETIVSENIEPTPDRSCRSTSRTLLLRHKTLSLRTYVRTDLRCL
jgi:hypothetical protein